MDIHNAPSTSLGESCSRHRRLTAGWRWGFTCPRKYVVTTIDLRVPKRDNGTCCGCKKDSLSRVLRTENGHLAAGRQGDEKVFRKTPVSPLYEKMLESAFGGPRRSLRGNRGASLSSRGLWCRQCMQRRSPFYGLRMPRKGSSLCLGIAPFSPFKAQGAFLQNT